MSKQREKIYRPGWVSDGPTPFLTENACGFYRVLQDQDLIAVYHCRYFNSTAEIIADLLELIKARCQRRWGEDYAIWNSRRIMVVIHQPMDGGKPEIVRFGEARNDPMEFFRGERPDGVDGMVHYLEGVAFPGWPTRDEWIKRGRGDIWYDRSKV